MTERKKHLCRAALLILAALCVAAGIVMGQQEQVWAKAAKICLDCIGIG